MVAQIIAVWSGVYLNPMNPHHGYDPKNNLIACAFKTSMLV